MNVMKLPSEICCLMFVCVLLQMNKWTQSLAVAVTIVIHLLTHQMMTTTMMMMLQRNAIILATPTAQHILQTLNIIKYCKV